MNERTSRVAIDPQSIIDDTRTMNFSPLSIEHIISPLSLQTEIHIDFKFVTQATLYWRDYSRGFSIAEWVALKVLYKYPSNSCMNTLNRGPHNSQGLCGTPQYTL